MERMKCWSATDLLSLYSTFQQHNALDQVTVVKRDGCIHMTNLLEICDSFVSESYEQLAAVRMDTKIYTKQTSGVLSSAPDNHMLKLSGIDPLLLTYPFGGIDVVSALGLNPNVDCIVFSGAECFSSSAQNLSNDLSKLLCNGSLYMKKGAGATMFDSHDDFERLHDELGLSGVGALALVRLLGAMEYSVDLITFFTLDEKGDIICNSPLSPVSATDPFHHVVIGIRANTSDVKSDSDPSVERGKLLYFIQHNTHVDDAKVDAFFARLRPDILLIKAAPDSLWCSEDSGDGDCSDRTGSAQHDAALRCRQRALAPAVATDCVVVTDSCQRNPTTPPQIFRNNEKVVSIPFKDLAGGGIGTVGCCERGAAESEDRGSGYEVFGYGERVFLSTGGNLDLLL